MRQLRYFYRMHLENPEKFFEYQKTIRRLLDAQAYWGHVVNPALPDRLATIDAALRNRDSILAGVSRGAIEGALNHYVTPPPASAVYFKDAWGEIGARAPGVAIAIYERSHSVMNGVDRVILLTD